MSESSSEDESFAEEVLQDYEKSGVLERKKEGDKKTKFYWYLLIKGTLFEYRTIKQKEPKETFHLKDCEIVEVSEPISTAFEVRKKGKTLLLLLPQSLESREDWVKSLKSSLSLPPADPPVRDVAKKGTLRMRMKKTIAGKVAISSPGKFIAKSSVPEEVLHLIDSLRALMLAYIGEKEGLIVEDDIIKLYVKCFCLEEDGQIEMKQFVPVDQPIRKAFASISKLRDDSVAMKIPSLQVLDQRISEIKSHLFETQEKLTLLLLPHLKPKSISKIGFIFQHISNPDFLKKAIVGPSDKSVPFLEEEIDSLCTAIDKYLSIPYYQED